MGAKMWDFAFSYFILCRERGELENGGGFISESDWLLGSMEVPRSKGQGAQVDVLALRTGKGKGKLFVLSDFYRHAESGLSV